MDIITAVIYIVLFIIMMVFVFSIGMLKQYMPKREVLLVLAVAFLIGSIGGAFFLEPIYEELPNMASIVERNMPNNEESLYLDLSSSVDTDSLREELSSMEGFKSFDETSISIPMWNFNQKEHDYFDSIVGNINTHYKNYNVTSDKINIELEDNFTASEALKSFSDWYKLVYGETISYAQIQAVLVVDSSQLDNFEQALLNKGIVASSVDGPIQDSINNTNSSMLSNVEFTLVCGCVGVIVALIGIYMDSVVPAYRRFKKFMNTKRKR
ncbi:MAG: hypothetical protein IJ672_06060 [Methanobrevibacter sp.]|uniref:hypothetical protein n=1 Tax=Methanobrevibacter sp. TaxID=66852 RepID=UPI0025D2CD42|nr:hypothetical protein [Methanobrevibacter sp.]MBQ8017405.1 hypothetical protein [Methanobrevibacter sp.]MBR1611031.1 hypothetical protein [Methanobrevibacter sp.]